MEHPNRSYWLPLVYAKSEKSQDVRSKVLFLDKYCSLKLLLIAESPLTHRVVEPVTSPPKSLPPAAAHVAQETFYNCLDFCEVYDRLRETHDWFRKPGSFDTTLEKIGCINRAGIRSVVMTTVSGKNIDEVPGIIDAVVKAGVNVFAFARYCPTSEEKDTGIEPLRYRRLLADCDKKFKEYEAAGCSTYFNKKDHLWMLYEYETGTFKIPEEVEEGMIYGGCNCGNCHLTILPTVITMFAPKDFLFSVDDCAVAAENMMLAADALGVGSCYIGQGWTAFADPYGQEILKQWGIRTDYYAVIQLLLGYPREGDTHPQSKPRKNDRVLRF